MANEEYMKWLEGLGTLKANRCFQRRKSSKRGFQLLTSSLIRISLNFAASNSACLLSAA
jgi:hypothetical protein